MGFMDELKKLTQPYEEDDDFFEGASENFRPAAPAAGDASSAFENTFGAAAPQQAASAPRKSKGRLFGGRQPQQQQPPQQFQPSYAPDSEEDAYADDPEAGGLFGNFSLRRAPKAPRGRAAAMNYAQDSQMILYNPKSFDDARELVSYLQQGRSVVMTLEGIPTDFARRILDLCSGIALALDGKITPVSAKTYFVTPANVDVVGAQEQQQ